MPKRLRRMGVWLIDHLNVCASWSLLSGSHLCVFSGWTLKEMARELPTSVRLRWCVRVVVVRCRSAGRAAGQLSLFTVPKRI